MRRLALSHKMESVGLMSGTQLNPQTLTPVNFSRQFKVNL